MIEGLELTSWYIRQMQQFGPMFIEIIPKDLQTEEVCQAFIIEMLKDCNDRAEMREDLFSEEPEPFYMYLRREAPKYFPWFSEDLMIAYLAELPSVTLDDAFFVTAKIDEYIQKRNQHSSVV